MRQWKDFSTEEGRLFLEGGTRDVRREIHGDARKGIPGGRMGK